jgi:hypothetical protein
MKFVSYQFKAYPVVSLSQIRAIQAAKWAKGIM